MPVTAGVAEVEIAQRKLGPGHPALIVAEIGNNHDGRLGQAKALIEAAAEAGADAVKFQTHIAQAEMLESVPTPPHFDEPRFEFTKRVELSLDDHLELKALAESVGVLFFSSPFSVDAVALLERIDVPAYKLASGEVTNPPLIEAIAATGRPVLVSTGMSDIDDIDAAIGILRDAGSPYLVLQCTSTYPCPPDQVNLRAMETLADRYDCLVGLSDHAASIYPSIAAVARGAVCVEKHFTLSRHLYGPDHRASLEPEDLARLVQGIREVEAALGSPEKQRDPAHDPVRATFEKSVVTTTAIPEGTVIEPSMLSTKRPGTGIPATRLESVLGRRAARSLEPDYLVSESDLA